MLRKKLVGIIIVILITAFISLGSSNKSIASEGKDHNHHIAIFLGLTYNKHLELDKQTFFVAGADYEYRLPFASRLLGLTAIFDMTFATHKVKLLAGGLVLHPYGGLKLIAAPGMEFEGGHSEFGFRAG
ncbi:MAG: hypothetical protein OEV44_14760, partial [Spirochaetota bacterium]|nr:hypothetical protein [Spirochaetota bacterium]